MNSRKHSEVQRVLSFLVICGLMSSVVIPLYGYGTSGSDSGYGEEIPYVYAYVIAYSLRYTGDWVKAEQSAYLQNTSTHRLEDVTYDWRFRLQITGIDEKIKDEREKLTPVIRESIDEDSGTVKIGKTMSAFRYMSVSANGLIAGDDYGMIAYTRLTVTGSVKKGGRRVTKTEEWFTEPYDLFRAM